MIVSILSHIKNVQTQQENNGKVNCWNEVKLTCCIPADDRPLLHLGYPSRHHRQCPTFRWQTLPPVPRVGETRSPDVLCLRREIALNTRKRRYTYTVPWTNCLEWRLELSCSLLYQIHCMNVCNYSQRHQLHDCIFSKWYPLHECLFCQRDPKMYISWTKSIAWMYNYFLNESHCMSVYFLSEIHCMKV